MDSEIRTYRIGVLIIEKVGSRWGVNNMAIGVGNYSNPVFALVAFFKWQRTLRRIARDDN